MPSSHDRFRKSGRSFVEGEKVLWGRYILLEVIGQGSYGVVYLAKTKSIDGTGDLVAIKELPKITNFNRKHQRRINPLEEIGFYKQLNRHPNVITLLEVVEETNTYFLVMEYTPHGDLFEVIMDQGKFNSIVLGDNKRGIAPNKTLIVKNLICQIIEAVGFCHRNGIYHRDLKSENILVFSAAVPCRGGNQKSQEGQSSCPVLKLADFGLASTEVRSKQFGCGSLFYMSPECYHRDETLLKATVGGESYDCAKNDIWSIGVIMVNLVCRRNPWNRPSVDDRFFAAYMKNPTILIKMLHITPDFCKLLNKIFAVDPMERISLSEIATAVEKIESFRCEEEIPRQSHALEPSAVGSRTCFSKCSKLGEKEGVGENPNPSLGFYFLR